MKINKFLLIFAVLLISLLAISTASAADDNVISDNSVLSSDIGEISNIDQNDLLSADAEAAQSPQINLSTKDTPYNERATVNITTNINATRPVVNIFVDGNAVKNLTLYRQGKGTYNIPAKTYDVGMHTVEVSYNDTTYGIISNSVILNITQVTPIVSVKDVTVKAGEIVTVPFTVTDNKGKGMAGKALVTIYLNDGGNVSQIVEFNDFSKFNFDFSSLFNGTNLFNGTSLNISGLFNGTDFNISALFNGTDFNISGLFNGTTFNITGLFNGTSLFNGTGLNITGLLNGTGLNITGLFNGTGLNLTGLFDGTGLNITGLFNGTDFTSLFNGTDFSNNFNITDFDFESIFNRNSEDSSNPDSSDLLMISLADVILKADKQNFNISDLTKGNSTFNISGLLDGLGIDLSKIFGGSANEHNATFDYPFEPGTYKMSVEFLGDDNYASVTNDTAKLTVLGEIELDAKIDTPKKPGDKTTVDIYLKNETGDPMAGAKVQISLNGEDKGTVTLDENGYAQVTFDNLTAGHYVLVLTYGNVTKTFEFDISFDENSENHAAAKTVAVEPVAGNPIVMMILSVFVIIGLGFRKQD